VSRPSGQAGCRPAALLAGLAFLAAPGAPAPVAAQERSLIDPGTAHLQRELRSLQNRGPSPGADMQLDRARRNLLREGGGVYFTPEQARIGRQLERLRRDLRRQGAPPAPEPPVVLPDEPLPRSYGRDEAGSLPSSTRQSLLTANRLVDRAVAALEAGRARQARSDLATAKGLVGEGPQAGDEEVARLRARIDGIEARLAEAGDG
jgi:hypothetical protein